MISCTSPLWLYATKKLRADGSAVIHVPHGRLRFCRRRDEKRNAPLTRSDPLNKHTGFNRESQKCVLSLWRRVAFSNQSSLGRFNFGVASGLLVSTLGSGALLRRANAWQQRATGAQLLLLGQALPDGGRVSATSTVKMIRIMDPIISVKNQILPAPVASHLSH